MGRLVINGEEIYELDEECLKEKYEKRIQRNRYSDVTENGRNADRKYGAKKDKPK